MKALSYIVGFFFSLILIGILFNLSDALTPTVAGLNLSDFHNAEWKIYPIACLFVVMIGCAIGVVTSLRGNDRE